MSIPDLQPNRVKVLRDCKKYLYSPETASRCCQEYILDFFPCFSKKRQLRWSHWKVQIDSLSTYDSIVYQSHLLTFELIGQLEPIWQKNSSFKDN